jgi:hypothetical protein
MKIANEKLIDKYIGGVSRFQSFQSLAQTAQFLLSKGIFERRRSLLHLSRKITYRLNNTWRRYSLQGINHHHK